MRLANRICLNILVIDDDAGAARALARLLRTYGHTVETAPDATRGLELASRMKLDLVMLDLAMPAMDGYEAARRLRAMSALSKTQLIACSGSVDETKARAAGFDGWLVKPISDYDLDAVLALVLQRVNATVARRESNSGLDAQ